MEFDYSKLKGRIVERFQTQSKFSGAMGISNRSLSLKLNGQRAFTQQEIVKATFLLSIDKKEISNYFFTPKVQNFKQTET